MVVRQLLFISLIAILQACARMPTAVERPVWPDSLPPVSYFQEIYAGDKINQEVQTEENYLTWVVRYYKGWKLYPNGWEDAMADVLHATQEADKTVMEEKMKRLGQLVSGEWAKESPERVIWTKELTVWGRALLESVERNQQGQYIDQVTSDVEAMLDGRLDRDLIALSRYFEVEDDLDHEDY